MKKWIACALTVLLVLSLCACGSSEGGGKKDGLYVGFGRESIVPEYEVHMAGGDLKSRTNDGFRDMLYVTCVAITEGGETLLFYTMDFIGSSDNFVNPARDAISEATGVPVDHIWMNATHTHAGVAINSEWDKTKQYREEFNEAATKAAKDAIADQAKAEVYYGHVETEGMAFVRHYNMADGTVAGSNFGSFSGTIVGHTVEADNRLQLVNFVREGEDKKDVLLMSFPAHCTMNQNSTSLSADFPAPARDYIEKNANTLVAFFQGASGDQVPSSKIEGEIPTGRDHVAYGNKLGEYVVGILNGEMTVSQSSDITLYHEKVTANRMKEGIEDVTRLVQAKEVLSLASQYGNSSAQVDQKVAEYGFDNYYHASGLVARANAPDTDTITIHALVLGDISIAFAPYEMFSTQGKIIKDGTPYGMAFVVTNSEYHEGYMPNEIACEHGYYEYDISRFARGVGEQLSDRFVEIFKGIKEGTITG